MHFSKRKKITDSFWRSAASFATRSAEGSPDPRYPMPVPSLQIPPEAGAHRRPTPSSCGSMVQSHKSKFSSSTSSSSSSALSPRAMAARNAELRRRLQPYMGTKRQTDDAIAAARAQSRAAVKAQLEAKKAEALERRLHGGSSHRPRSAPGARRPQAAKANRQPQAQPTTVLATPVAAAAAAGGEGGTDELRQRFGELGSRFNKYTGQPLDSDMTTPQALRLPWGGNAQRYMEASTLDRNRTQRGLKAWDSTPHRTIPYGCRGIKLKDAKEQPWGKKSQEAWDHSESAGLGFATAALHRLDDGSNDDLVMLKKRREEEDRQFSDATNRKPWVSHGCAPL